MHRQYFLEIVGGQFGARYVRVLRVVQFMLFCLLTGSGLCTDNKFLNSWVANFQVGNRVLCSFGFICS